MKKIIALLFLGSFVTSTITPVFAMGGTPVTYSVDKLTPELNTIIENVKKECSLNPEQLTKFKNDYVLFLNENAKPNAKTQVLLFLLGTKIKPYLNEAQFSKVTKMGQEGKLIPKTATAAVSTVTNKTDGQPVAPSPSSTKSNITTLFEQLQSYMQITPEKSSQIIPILKDYDQQLTKIKTENEGNADKIKQLTDAVNNQVIPKLKMHMNDQQIGTLILALAFQTNILTGKDLTADQKLFLDKIRNQYGLNDTQTMSVILVLVQVKIRSDAINLIKTSNPQLAGQEYIKLLADVDGYLKTSLNNEQYNNVRADIIKLMKGEKL